MCIFPGYQACNRRCGLVHACATLEGYEVNMPWIESRLYHVHVFSCVSLFPPGLSLMSTIGHFRSYRVMDMDTMEILCQAEGSAACAHMEELIRHQAECIQDEVCEDEVLLF
jgi:hypothetical protein